MCIENRQLQKIRSQFTIQNYHTDKEWYTGSFQYRQLGFPIHKGRCKSGLPLVLKRTLARLPLVLV